MSAPLVSVVLTTYNRPQFLADSAKSILAQSWRNLELIIVDDGSTTPRTSEIAEAFVADDARVRFIKKENGGLSSSRNCGIKQARGEFVCFMDDDDLVHPRKVEMQVAVLQKHPDIDAVVCDGKYFEGADVPPILPMPDAPEIIIQHPNPPLESFPQRLAFWLDQNAMYRAGFLESRRYDEDYIVHEEIEFTLRLEEAISIARIPELLYFYRSHNSGNLLQHPMGWQYRCAAHIAATLRRQGRAVPDVPPPQLVRYMRELSPFYIRYMERYASKKSKLLLRTKNYAALSQLMDDYNLAQGSRLRFYLRALMWSLWFGKLPAAALAFKHAFARRAQGL